MNMDETKLDDEFGRHDFCVNIVLTDYQYSKVKELMPLMAYENPENDEEFSEFLTGCVNGFIHNTTLNDCGSSNFACWLQYNINLFLEIKKRI